MNRSPLRVVLLAACLLGIVDVADAQAVLPAHLRTQLFSYERPSAAFTLAGTLDTTVDVRMWHRARGMSGERSVGVQHRVTHGRAAPWPSAAHVEPVDFHPLDVVAARAVGRRAYVIGWDEAASRVVIERWELTLVGPIVSHPRGTELRVDRRVIARLDIAPMQAACSAPHVGRDGALVLLSATSPRTLHLFDLATSTLACETLDDERAWPALQNASSLIAIDAKHAGHVLLLTRVAKQHGWPRYIDVPVVYYRDTNRDGTYDEKACVTDKRFHELMKAWKRE